MTTQPHDLRELRFDESVRLPLWMIGVLGLVLGVTAGVLTGVAIRNLLGDEPIISGPEAGIFYVAFSLAVLMDVFLLLNFTNLSITVADAGAEFRFGVFGKSFSWTQVIKAEATDYKWITYGGWGIRFSTKGRRAWSQIGAKRGVVVDVTEGKNHRHYFISSNRPEELAAALNRGIAAKAPTRADEATTAGSGNPPA